MLLTLKKDSFMPRGIRNNNPGNIKESPYDKTVWLGERATNDDPIFEEFDSAVYGIRALTKIIKNYRALYSLSTIEQIISRYAPGSENDTENYIKFVSSCMSKPRNQPLNFTVDLVPLVKAIIRFENGIQPYSDTTIKTGISLA